jgi:hypothetical protein
MGRTLACLTVMVGLACAGRANAAPPQLVNYQGEVTDGGLPVANGNYPMEFRIFGAAAGGIALWSEAIANVPTSNGRFNVLLGQATALPESIFDGTERWLEVVFNGDLMSPRVRLVTVPYAHRISTVDGARGGSISGDVDISTTTIAWGLEVNNSGAGGAGRFANNNPASPEAALTGVHVGGGAGGSFLSDGGGSAVMANSSVGGYGVYATAPSGVAVYGQGSGTADSSKAIHGRLTSTSPGQYSAAVRGENLGLGGSGIGVWGSHPASGWGVYGTATTGRGVYGTATNGQGVRGLATTGEAVYGSTTNGSGVGLYGENSSNSANAIAIHGVLDNTSAGSFSSAIRGENLGTGLTGVGVYGSHNGGGWGVYGVANSVLGRGVYGESSNGVGLYGHSDNNLAGYFTGGRVQMTGGTDASTAGMASGYLVLGQTNSTNIVIDNNEIIARNNGVADELHLQAEGGPVMIGALGITPPAGYSLVVDGKAILEEVEVQLSQDWPDYVFEEGYDLMSIDALAEHVRTKKHLPGIPSQEAMKDSRLPVGEMQTKLLEKVEELALYIVQLKEQLDAAARDNAALQSRVEALELDGE